MFSIRPINGRELEKNDRAVLQWENETSIVVSFVFQVPTFLFDKMNFEQNFSSKEHNTAVDLRLMECSMLDRHKKKFFIIVESNVWWTWRSMGKFIDGMKLLNLILNSILFF